MVRRVRWPAFLLLAVLPVFAKPHRASACSCSEPLPLSEYARRADVIFVGIALEPTPGASDGDVSYGFRVTQDVKGQLAADTIETWRDTASCGQRFVVGTEYIVFASRDASGSLRTDACYPNQAAAAGGGASRFDIAALLDVMTSLRREPTAAPRDTIPRTDATDASRRPPNRSTFARERSGTSLGKPWTAMGLVLLALVAGWIGGVRWERRRRRTE